MALELAACRVLLQLANAVPETHEGNREGDETTQKKGEDRTDIRHSCSKQVCRACDIPHICCIDLSYSVSAACWLCWVC